MRNSIILFFVIGLLSTAFCQISVANDTTINRVVTVERDFQPIIQHAGKINIRPNVIINELQLTPVNYSTYSTPLAIGYTMYQLPAAETRFVPQAPLHGILEGGVGHRNTHLLFDYLKSYKKMSLDLYANHDAYWGKDALSQSKLGMLVTRHFSNVDLYFGIEGENESYKDIPLAWDIWQILWNANAKIGVRSTGKAAIQYRVQTGYNAFIVSDYAQEHSVQSHFDMWWTSQRHKAGIQAYVQNSFYTTYQDGHKLPAPRHNIRVEPFYEYKNQHIRLHAGVNLDMNIGTGELLSNVENLSFAPSPNLQFEWSMMNNIFHVYANATGQYGLGTWQEYMGYNRYLNSIKGLSWDSPRAYTPVDAQVGFKIRPAKTLLIDIYGGYAYFLRACNMHAEERYDQIGLAYYSLWLSDFQRWKIGVSLHYHYRDIIELNMGGNYYFYQQDPIPSMDPTAPYFQEVSIKGTTIFDRPNWDAYARVEAHIDSKWSVYSENYLTGSRMAFVQKYPDGATVTTLRPIISLNIGGQYAINRWLMVYLQLNDYLNRKEEIFYGFQSQGIHFLAGVRWQF
ncbi:MAG: hypothetical protein IKY87_04390 [Paludibacteraceae bacterium]|nr:hypothetical protein [Paludibacteraceae bacterium]